MAVPESQREADKLVLVGNSGEAILAPAISAAARLIVRKGIPRRSVGAVVLAHRAPLPLRQVRTPALPVCLSFLIFLQAKFFSGHGCSPASLTYLDAL